MSFWPPISSLLLSYILLYIATTKTSPVFGFTNETDREALVSIKSQIVNYPFEALSSWNDSINFCSWEGVSCSHRHMRVIALELPSLELAGFLSPYVGNLTFLKKIVLANNTFHGPIPQELGRLFRLRSVRLNDNSFVGEFPVNLTRCTRLEFIDLSRNILTGMIPSVLGNLSALRTLSLSQNKLEGSIPVEFGQLSNLEFLELSSNKLSGTVPILIYNISSIQYLSLAFNSLSGEFPPDLGLTLPKLLVVSVRANQFSGRIPASITNASGLENFDIAMNEFTGPVPTNLGNLKNLQQLRFSENRMGSNEANDFRFLTSLANCANLTVLHLNGNGYRGNLPDSIANLSSKLISLRLDENNISGSIPHGIGNLTNLQGIDISRNELSGEIPPSIGNITLLTVLYMQENLLQGSIPVSLGNCKNLLSLDLSNNQLVGAVPGEVIGLSSLSLVLNLSHNHLNGSLPAEVSYLGNLGNLDISNNEFSGELPQGLGRCVVLEFLNVEGNLFEGAIPQSLESLRGIQVLELSRNKFSGTIPEFLVRFPFIQQLDISFNMFEGEVPSKGIFRNGSAFLFSGNEKLCGGIKLLNLPACPKEISTRKRRKLSAVKVAVLVSGITLGLLMFLAYARATLYRTKKVSKKEPILELEPPLENQNYPRISYAELVQATDGFSPKRLIGQGKFSSVYKGALSSVGPIVAVKVLNLQQSGAAKCFVAECEALRNTRHRNIVKIITSCSGIDFKGNDFKALVLEIMPNGSLESWLHPSSFVKPTSSKMLNLIQRLNEFKDLVFERMPSGSLERWLYPRVSDLEMDQKKLNMVVRINIAIDVASALHYFHHHCESPIIHCDLKPSNVLLDDELCAHVGDFGLARILVAAPGTASHIQSSSSIGIRGTVGYVAPEYGMGGEVSTQGDVYSYGILLLEIFTGKRPTNIMCADGLSLHNYATMVIPDRVMEIIDPLLVFNESDSANQINVDRIKECFISVFRIAVACSAELPRERMDIRDALVELHGIRNAFLQREERVRERER